MSCQLNDGWLMDYLKSILGATRLRKHLRLPISFRQYEEEELETKRNKTWSFPIKVKYDTYLKDFIGRFEPKLAPARVHFLDAVRQEKTYKHLFHDGFDVIPFMF